MHRTVKDKQRTYVGYWKKALMEYGVRQGKKNESMFPPRSCA